MVAEAGYGPVQVHGVPKCDGGDDQVESAGTVALIFEATVVHFPLAIEEDGAGESVSGFPFVKPDLHASAQSGSLIHSNMKRGRSMLNVPQTFCPRSAADVSFGDLRDTPTVLVGGFNNRWTLAMTKDLPYSFRDGTRIVECNHPEHSWGR